MSRITADARFRNTALIRTAVSLSQLALHHARRAWEPAGHALDALEETLTRGYAEHDLLAVLESCDTPENPYRDRVRALIVTQRERLGVE